MMFIHCRRMGLALKNKFHLNLVMRVRNCSHAGRQVQSVDCDFFQFNSFNAFNGLWISDLQALDSVRLPVADVKNESQHSNLTEKK